MMPLSLADANTPLTIRKIGGNPALKQHLENLGFTVGETVTLISNLGENVIVKVKESRVAIGADMARKIMV
ncbi:MAG: ferrous iron transport protein A [Oscillospiraceae bacterium]|jgi:ferrous iron transport protein A|nr:ferrous iron transport protein A [Oscillospiraceae bacterium]MBQ5337629.1 ferrous iron transport protein A [Oscillospiraceae bacterium]MBQ9907412.1 ferrous iron transport protein A [Oscillospiraceae bacterium]